MSLRASISALSAWRFLDTSFCISARAHNSDINHLIYYNVSLNPGESYFTGQYQSHTQVRCNESGCAVPLTAVPVLQIRIVTIRVLVAPALCTASVIARASHASATALSLQSFAKNVCELLP